MTRSQALTIGIMFGFVVLIFGGLAVFLFSGSFEGFAAPTPSPTATPLPPPEPTPTFPNFLPTPSREPPVQLQPTATNTRLPTATPQPAKTPTPTIVFQLTLPLRRPTATPILPPADLVPATVTGVPSVEPTATVQLQYNISFEAQRSRIDEGKCTRLSWRVEGAMAVRLDGEPVASASRDEVCPKKDTTYRLTVYLPDGNQVTRELTITVRKNDNDNNSNNSNGNSNNSNGNSNSNDNNNNNG